VLNYEKRYESIANKIEIKIMYGKKVLGE